MLSAAALAALYDHADTPLAEGRLSFDPPRGKPVLDIQIVCPYCRKKHWHTWSLGEDGEFDLTIEARAPHCRFGSTHTYRIRPLDDAKNRAVSDSFRPLYVRWRRRAGHADLPWMTQATAG